MESYTLHKINTTHTHTHTRAQKETKELVVKTHLTQREKLLTRRNAKKNVKRLLLNTIYLRFPKEKECEREERTTTTLVLL